MKNHEKHLELVNGFLVTLSVPFVHLVVTRAWNLESGNRISLRAIKKSCVRKFAARKSLSRLMPEAAYKAGFWL